MNDDEDAEDPELTKLRETIKRLAGTKGKMSTAAEIRLGRLTIHVEDAEIGYTNADAINELDKLNDTQIRRLASMAIRCFDSPWSDAGRDLSRGVEAVLDRKPKEDE